MGEGIRWEKGGDERGSRGMESSSQCYTKQYYCIIL